MRIDVRLRTTVNRALWELRYADDPVQGVPVYLRDILLENGHRITRTDGWVTLAEATGVSSADSVLTMFTVVDVMFVVTVDSMLWRSFFGVGAEDSVPGYVAMVAGSSPGILEHAMGTVDIHRE